MPNYPYPHYPPPPPPAGAQAPAKRNNIVGLIALIASIIGFVFACIPGALIVGWVLLPIAFVLGIVGLFLSGKAKGTSIAAIIVSIIGTVVGVVVFFTVASDAFKDAFNKPDLWSWSCPSHGVNDDGRRFLQELPTQRRKDYARVSTSITHGPDPWRDRRLVRRVA